MSLSWTFSVVETTVGRKELGSLWVVIFCKVVRGGLTDKGTFKQRLAGAESRGNTSIKALREGDKWPGTEW